MHRLRDSDFIGARVSRRLGSARRRDETGQALVEFALVLPLLVLLMGIAFNGWNAMELSIRLTSAARAGAIAAANTIGGDNLQPGQAVSQAQQQAAQYAAMTAVNAEEGVSAAYQDTDDSKPNYVAINTNSQDQTTNGPTIGTVTITISPAPATLIPFVGKISVTTDATARYQ
jgi:Flp pilus assembly protein TadG